MKQAEVKEFDGVKYVKTIKKLVNVGKLHDNFNSVVHHIVAEIDEQKTLSNMYQAHIDYGVAQKHLKTAIEKSKVMEITHETVRTPNR